MLKRYGVWSNHVDLCKEQRTMKWYNSAVLHRPRVRKQNANKSKMIHTLHTTHKDSMGVKHLSRSLFWFILFRLRLSTLFMIINFLFNSQPEKNGPQSYCHIVATLSARALFLTRPRAAHRRTRDSSVEHGYSLFLFLLNLKMCECWMLNSFSRPIECVCRGVFSFEPEIKL